MTLSSIQTGAREARIVDDPVFIVASERSGTTLLRLMLDGHPDLTWCHEFSYVVDQLGQNGALPDLESYYSHLELDRVFQSAGFDIDKRLDYEELVNSFLLQRLDTHGGRIVGANVHRGIARLPQIWPNARYIHLVRDPRDVAASIIEQGWYGCYWHAADHWARAEDEWEQLRETLDDHQYIEVTFESLIANPESTLAQACDFIGVTYTDDVLENYVAGTDYEPVDPTRIQPWRHQVSVEDLGLVEARSADLLQRRGYELSGEEIPSLGAADLKRLDRLDRRKRIRARIEIYGLRLTLAEMTTRLFGLRRSWRRQRQRMNDVERRRLKKSW